MVGVDGNIVTGWDLFTPSKCDQTCNKQDIDNRFKALDGQSDTIKHERIYSRLWFLFSLGK